MHSDFGRCPRFAGQEGPHDLFDALFCLLFHFVVHENANMHVNITSGSTGTSTSRSTSGSSHDDDDDGDKKRKVPRTSSVLLHVYLDMVLCLMYVTVSHLEGVRAEEIS